MKVDYNLPVTSGRELDYVNELIIQGKQIGVNGRFTKLCREWLLNALSIGEIALTGSCTAAIEIAADLSGITAGSRVILPSFTHPSTANAFFLRNAELHFVDIDPETLCLDVEKVEAELDERARLIIPVHYAGGACDMERLMALAKNYEITVLEDAAHAFGSKYQDQYLGTWGDLGVFSFHETKNIHCGTGGAIHVKRQQWEERLHILLDKGTDRVKFEQKRVKYYEWQGWGSAYRLPELSAAYLWGQLENYERIQHRRMQLFETYGRHLADLEKDGLVSMPKFHPQVTHNAHIFYVILKNETECSRLHDSLLDAGIQAVTHYVPLHLSPVGRRLGYRQGDLPITEAVAKRILRLPLHPQLTPEIIGFISSQVHNFFGTSKISHRSVMDG